MSELRQWGWHSIDITIRRWCHHLVQCISPISPIIWRTWCLPIKRLSQLQKAKNIAPTAFLAQNISTKSVWFATFTNPRQNTVNAFERSTLLAAPVLEIPVLLASVPAAHCRQYQCWKQSASSTGASRTLLLAPVLKAQLLAEHCA